jgi:ABC-2 type transport system ATP-binding protein
MYTTHRDTISASGAQPPEAPPIPAGSTPLIEARGLTVRFGKVTALDGLDLTAPPGQVLAILGPNGAGKTTFVRALATLITPDDGTLCVRGADVRRDPSAVRRDIGLAGQYAAIEPAMTGRENLVMTARLFGHRPRAARAAAAAVLDQLGLGEVADRRCQGYSGGQRRRLDLGASLVGAPRLLLLDEPTTGLDPVGRAEVWEAVRALARHGTDLVLTTHYLDEADELADHAVVIDHGRAIAAGPLSALKASIGRDVIEVTVRDPARLAPAAAAISRATAARPAISHPVTDPARRQVTAPAPGGPAQLRAVIDALAAAGIDVDEIALRRPTLDEVFAALTTTAAPAPAMPDPAAPHTTPTASQR